MLLKFAVKDFLDDREFKNLSTATLSGYKFTLNEFHAYCVANGAIDVTEATPATLKGYLLHCQRERGNGPTSLNHKLGNLRIFFSYLEEIEAIDKKYNPARKVMPVKADVRIEVFTDLQIRQMLGYFQRMKSRDKTFYAYRDYTVIVTLLGTGVRLGELVNLRWDDVDLQNMTITVFGKRQQSSVPVTVKLNKELCEYKLFVERFSKGLSEFVFTDSQGERLTENGVKCIFKRLKQIMNFKGVRLSAHTFRHSFAVRMIKAGADVFTVQKMLRHTDLSMTMRYVNLFGTALREQNDKFNPLNGLCH